MENRNQKFSEEFKNKTNEASIHSSEASLFFKINRLLIMLTPYISLLTLILSVINLSYIRESHDLIDDNQYVICNHLDGFEYRIKDVIEDSELRVESQIADSEKRIRNTSGWNNW